MSRGTAAFKASCQSSKKMIKATFASMDRLAISAPKTKDGLKPLLRLFSAIEEVKAVLETKPPKIPAISIPSLPQSFSRMYPTKERLETMTTISQIRNGLKKPYGPYASLGRNGRITNAMAANSKVLTNSVPFSF